MPTWKCSDVEMQSLERKSVDAHEPVGRDTELISACRTIRAVLLNGINELGCGSADWTFVSASTGSTARSVVDYALCSSRLFVGERRYIAFRTHGIHHVASDAWTRAYVGINHKAQPGEWMAALFIDHAILSLRISSVLVQHSSERDAPKPRAMRAHPSGAKRRLVQSIDFEQWGDTCIQQLSPI